MVGSMKVVQVWLLRPFLIPSMNFPSEGTKNKILHFVRVACSHLSEISRKRPLVKIRLRSFTFPALRVSYFHHNGVQVITHTNSLSHN